MSKLIPLFLLLLPLFSKADFLVLLDPGHGGVDLGATRDSFVESSIVLQIAKKVQLELIKNKVTVELTRETNKSVSLKDRVRLANSSGADLFVSLHSNTSVSSSVTGMEFYFNSPKTEMLTPPSDKAPDTMQVLEKIKTDFIYYAKTEKSLILSKTIKAKTLSEQKSVIKRAPFYVIENTQMPSVLIELGFISNRRDAKKLASDEYQNRIAEAIAQSIMDYKEKSDKIHSL